jgi:hypothetical protein
VTAVQNIQETSLAWALIDTAKSHLNVGERNHVFTTVGAGDPFAAIVHLLKLIATKHIVLHPQLVQQCKAWIDAYALHEEQVRLRHLIQGFLIPDSIRALTAAPVTKAPAAMSIATEDGSAEAGRCGC